MDPVSHCIVSSGTRPTTFSTETLDITFITCKWYYKASTSRFVSSQLILDDKRILCKSNLCRQCSLQARTIIDPEIPNQQDHQDLGGESRVLGIKSGIIPWLLPPKQTTRTQLSLIQQRHYYRHESLNSPYLRINHIQITKLMCAT